MTDTLLNIPESAPPWRDLQQKHCIESQFSSDAKPESSWLAIYMNDESETGATEREAVVALIHKLQLDGWNTVSPK